MGSDWGGSATWGAAGEIIGLGLNIKTGEIFCTKDGAYVGNVTKNIFDNHLNVRFPLFIWSSKNGIFQNDEPLFAAVSIGGCGCVLVNFGEVKYAYDISQKLLEAHEIQLGKYVNVHSSY